MSPQMRDARGRFVSAGSQRAVWGPFTMEIDGYAQVLAGLARVSASLDDLTPIWDRYHVAFIEAETEQFQTQGGAGAMGHWPILSKQYAMLKAYLHPGMPLMVADGTLRDSLTTTGAGHVYDPQKDQVRMGTSVVSDKGAPYAIYHQRGMGNNPARKVIDIHPEQEAELFGDALRLAAMDIGAQWGGGGQARDALGRFTSGAGMV